MRVLIWTPNELNLMGGHLVQLAKTCQALRQLGVDCTFTTEAVSLDCYDILHTHGLPLEMLRQARHKGLKIAVSPIYSNLAYLLGESGKSRGELALSRTLLAARAAASAWLGQKPYKAVRSFECKLRVYYEMADVLLPNSHSEARTLSEELDTSTPCLVVPNAVDETVFKADIPPDDSRRIKIIYAGRFEPRKNQLGLIQAMRKCHLPLTLIGPPHPHHAAYYVTCQKIAAQCPHIEILPALAHEKLQDIYQSAKVHVLPSWMESPGLVSLEACLAGCNIVTATMGHVEEYFDDLAWFCQPGNPLSIRTAVEAAYHAPYQAALRERVLARYTWRHAAEATLQAYLYVLGKETTGQIFSPDRGPRSKRA